LDPVTVKRGRSYWWFTTVGTWHQWCSGWNIEKKRLISRGESVINWDNQVIRAWVRGLFVAGLVLWAGGWFGFVCWVAGITVTKLLVESLNYFSHYGIVREPGKLISPRHTFSDNSWMSNLLMYNLGRHGHHHAEPALFHELKAYPEMPMSPYNYIL